MHITERALPYIFFLLASAIFLVFGAGLQAFMPQQFALIAAEALCLLGFAVFMRHHWPKPTVMAWPSWGRTGGPIWLLLLTFVCGGVFGLCANMIGGLVIELVPGMQEQAATYAEQVKTMLNPETMWLQIAAVVSVTIAAPLCEEALFRGFLLPMQRQQERVGLAIIINGMLFGLMHLNPMALVSLSLLGMVLAALTVRSGSLWPAIICHAGVNTCNGVIVPRAAHAMGVELGAQSPPIGQLLGATVLFGGLSCMAIIMLWRLYGHVSTSDVAEARP